MPQFSSIFPGSLDTFFNHGSRDGIGLDIDWQESDEFPSNELDLITDAILQIERSLGGGIGIGAGLWDTDQDTGIQVEEAADDDIIRFDTAGVERMVILANGKVGLGTPTVPHGGTGAAMLALDGENNTANGPHVQFTTASDDYPLLQIVPLLHDAISLYFDAYSVPLVGTYSSDVGSNFAIVKYQDLLRFQYDSAVAQGVAVTFNDGIVLNTIGHVGVGTATPLALLDLQDITLGGGLGARIAFQFNTGGYRHWIQSEHSNVAADNMLYFYTNSGALAGDSTAPGVNNLLGLTIRNGRILCPNLTQQAAAGLIAEYWAATGEIYAEVSTKRFKEDIRELELDTSKLLDLMPKMYTDKKTGREEFGLIAEEVAEVMPEVVVFDEEGRPLGIKLTRLPIVLLNEIKKLNNRIKVLEA